MKLLIAACACVVGPAAAADLRLQLRPHAMVDAGVLRVGHVVQATSDDPVLLRGVIDMPLGHVTATGRSQRLSRPRLEALVGAAVRGSAVRVTWAGADVCAVAGRAPAVVATAAAASVRASSPARPRPSTATATQVVGEPSTERPSVVRGGSATLRSGTGGVVAETRVEVLQDGEPGERVLVRSATVPAPLSARVVGRELLEADR